MVYLLFMLYNIFLFMNIIVNIVFIFMRIIGYVWVIFIFILLAFVHHIVINLSYLLNVDYNYYMMMLNDGYVFIVSFFGSICYIDGLFFLFLKLYSNGDNYMNIIIYISNYKYMY